MSIHVLSDLVVAQIAAGEVVERPASAVKELVENALDAGATHIEVAISGSGRQMIRISDNGSGIPTHEVDLAFHRHATSKLHNLDDLATIQTLGFRGEALASIAAVSQLSMTTRHRNEAVGTRLRLDGGVITQQEAVGAPAGTVITVENLFFNTPARLKFLKKENTEKRHIVTVVTRYAMAYSQVRFVLLQDGREVFRSSGSGQLADVLVAALGIDSFKDMVEVDGETQPEPDSSPIRVSGFTSAPNLNRADRSHITLFVNGRSIQDTSLTYAVTQAYHTLLMTGRHPVAVLMVELSPEDVDVNVHPTKAEVRFKDPGAVFSAVQRAVRQAVVMLAQTPTLRGGRYMIQADSQADDESWSNAGMQRRVQLDMGLELESAGQYPRQIPGREMNDDEDDPTAIPVGMGVPAKPRTLPILRVVGQVGATYIVAEGPAGLYLVDQHAAHERILYEQFMEEHARHEQPRQYALESQTIDLAPGESRLVEANLDALRAVGFEVEPFGTNTFVIRSVPAMLADYAPAEVFLSILEDLEQGHKPGQASVEEKIIIRVCKRAAVKAGQILSLTEMQGLIRQLERCQSPHTCPHGRPTMLHMTSDQLAREFGRLGH
ncbi:MAG: DNA mismatch repair endonuclease MutL [Anaerolineaceae bacterium]|nr:DNA mismatch repair endonuclease MutL [Anaerolineaceae bacterium]